jgi:hypothetical protein
MRRLPSAFALSLFALALPLCAHAQAVRSLRGFTLVDAKPGVELYKHAKDYLQVIDPRRAHVRFIQGAPSPLDDARTAFARRTIADAWKDEKKRHSRLFSLVNGQFFDMGDAPVAALAFSVKADGLVYAGYGDTTEFPGRKRMLTLAKGRAAVLRYDDDAFGLETRPEKDILVGLEPGVPKSPASRLGRTLIGVSARGRLLIYSSPAAQQRRATRLMQGFGVPESKILLLDGGASAQLATADSVLVPERGREARDDDGETLRMLPQLIGIESGE